MPQKELFQADTACLLAKKRFFLKEDIMNGLRFWAPSLSAFYCVIWGLIDSSVPTAERIGGAFLAAGLRVCARSPST